MSEQHKPYQRYIHLADPQYDMDAHPETHERIKAWLQANDIAPEEVPLHQVINLAEDGMEIVVFNFRHNGTRFLRESGPFGYIKTIVAVPLKVRPEEFGL